MCWRKICVEYCDGVSSPALVVNTGWIQMLLYVLVPLFLVPLRSAEKLRKCRDTDMNCANWVRSLVQSCCFGPLFTRDGVRLGIQATDSQIASNRSSCDSMGLVMEHCARMCQTCGEIVDPSENLTFQAALR